MVQYRLVVSSRATRLAKCRLFWPLAHLAPGSRGLRRTFEGLGGGGRERK